MTIWDSWHDPILINTVGHWAGVLLFSVTILLLARNWRLHSMPSVKLSLIAAGLALGWNFGSLAVLGWPNAKPAWLAIIVAASFSMLTMLPAVLLHVISPVRQRLLTGTGYAVSITAALLHCGELFAPAAGLHQIALLLVAAGFGVLSITALATSWIASPKLDSSQRASFVCLLLFSSSFPHFGYHHAHSPWTAEITWHHLGVPIALILLLKDYRFLLLDTFLRFVVNFGLAVLYAGLLLSVTIELKLWLLIRSSLFAAAGLLVAGCLSLILFAHVRNSIEAWMNKVIFRRQSLADCQRKLEAVALSATSEDDLLAGSAKHIAAYFRTDQFALSKPLREMDPYEHVLIADIIHDQDAEQRFRPEGRIPLRFSAGNNRYIYLGRRRGSQRYWSDDLLDMGHLGTVLVEQVERFRVEELNRLVNQAELRALQAQINPHFLFNALNTLYGTIDRGSTQARTMVLNLADIFRYFLQGERTYIPLSEELRIVEAYLQIEELRLGRRLTWELRVTEKSRSAMIPILTLQPLVENAIKHGIAPNAAPGRVLVKAEDSAAGFRISVQDSGSGFAGSNPATFGLGMGLENVRRRLALSYGASTQLEIHTGADGTTVSFIVPPGTDKQLLPRRRGTGVLAS